MLTLRRDISRCFVTKVSVGALSLSRCSNRHLHQSFPILSNDDHKAPRDSSTPQSAFSEDSLKTPVSQDQRISNENARSQHWPTSEQARPFRQAETPLNRRQRLQKWARHARKLNKSVNRTRTERMQKAEPKITKEPAQTQMHTPVARYAKHTISLLEELFPNEVKNRSYHSVPPSAFENPKPILPNRDIPLLSFDTANVAINPALNESARDQPKEQDYSPLPCILYFYRAGFNLIWDDFKRIVPTGEHIEGWNPRGAIRGIIRARNKVTLEPNGEYMLLFENEKSARHYMIHAKQLHGWAKTFTGKTTSDLIPSPPMLIGKADGSTEAYQKIDNYTLVPPARELTMKIRTQPFGAFVEHIIRDGGYPKLMQGRRSDHEVLLSIDGTKTSQHDIERAMWKDSHARGTPWSTVGPWRGIRMITLPLSPYDENESEELMPHQPYARKYIISFSDEAEAKRFVLSWHRRDMSELLELPVDNDTFAIASADYIW